MDMAPLIIKMGGRVGLWLSMLPWSSLACGKIFYVIEEGEKPRCDGISSKEYAYQKKRGERRKNTTY